MRWRWKWDESYLTRTRRGERKRRGKEQTATQANLAQSGETLKGQGKRKAEADGHGTRPAEGKRQKRLNQPTMAKPKPTSARAGPNLPGERRTWRTSSWKDASTSACKSRDKAQRPSVIKSTPWTAYVVNPRITCTFEPYQRPSCLWLLDPEKQSIDVTCQSQQIQNCSCTSQLTRRSIPFLTIGGISGLRFGLSHSESVHPSFQPVGCSTCLAGSSAGFLLSGWIGSVSISPPVPVVGSGRAGKRKCQCSEMFDDVMFMSTCFYYMQVAQHLKWHEHETAQMLLVPSSLKVSKPKFTTFNSLTSEHFQLQFDMSQISVVIFDSQCNMSIVSVTNLSKFEVCWNQDNRARHKR